MTPEIAQAALQFLSRTQLQGSEVDAYNTVKDALMELINVQPVLTSVSDEDIPEESALTEVSNK